MSNKMVTREINSLKDKIKEIEIEIENKRIKQDLKETTDYWMKLYNESKYDSEDWQEYSSNLEKTLNDLKAELTYWKETAKNWKDLYKETDSALQYFKAHTSNLEKALTNSIKSVDK